MHASSLENMQRCYEQFICKESFSKPGALKVLDIGGANINGSYADIFSPDKFEYIAADLVAGEGVDLVLKDAYSLPFLDKEVDIVISGQTFEHVEYFWLLFEEMTRVLNDEGWIVLIAPSAGPIHDYPVDCYRFYPDAFRALAKLTKLNIVNLHLDERGPWCDLVGVFTKKAHTQIHKQTTWSPLPKEMINRYAAERGAAPIKVPDQSADIEKVRGESSYLAILEMLHDSHKPSTYLEIGVRNGNSLRLSKCRSIAIDPEPEIELDQFDAVSLFSMPSDHFFLNQTTVDFEEHPIDLAFIDGMHLFEFVLRDFINIETRIAANGVVVIDDIFPNHVLQASRIRKSRVWTGDVWKFLICIMQYRPDLDITMIDSHPTGLLLIKGLDKTNKVLVNNYNPVVRKITKLCLNDYSSLILERSQAISPSRWAKSLINYNGQGSI